MALPRSCLRRYKHSRNALYYKLGTEHIDKEMDVGNIIKKIRTLNFFMKMILDTDQRKLLKLRSSKAIESDESESQSIFNVKKYVDKDRMLEIYIENLRQKEIDERDVKLLRITGLEEIVGILQARHLYHQSLRREKLKQIPEIEHQEMWKQGVNVADLKDILHSNFNIGLSQLDLKESAAHIDDISRKGSLQ